MMRICKFGMLALLLAAFTTSGTAPAQVKTLPVNPGHAVMPPYWYNGGGWGWNGGGWGWNGGGWGWGNPYNPYSFNSPFNPYNAISPYNPYSLNNPFNNPYVAYNANNNPFMAYALWSPNPYVRSYAMATYNAVGYYDAVWYNNAIATANYQSMVYNNYAMANAYAMQSYNQQASLNTLATYSLLNNMASLNAVTNLATANAYLTMASANNNNVMNPYAMQGGQAYSSPYSPNRMPQQQAYGPPPGDFYGPPQGPPPPMKGGKPNQDMYVKLNSTVPSPPNFSQDQAKMANQQLKRIQSYSSPIEISNGTALNVLLDDMRKRIGKKVGMEPINLSEDVLSRINVIQNAGNLGLVRDDGKINWPVAFADEDILKTPVKEMVNVVVRNAVLAAEKDKVDAQDLKKLRQQIEVIRTNLVKKINDLPTMDYLDAKRFLNDLDDARIALERNEAPGYLKYRKFITGGKTVQELVDFMVANGMKFAPATSRDEGAYRALHSGMAAFDVALNAQFPGPPPPPE